MDRWDQGDYKNPIGIMEVTVASAGATVAFNEIRGADSWRLEELEDVH